MADMSGNLSSTAAIADHRTYTDDGLSWPNRKTDFIAVLVPFLALAWIAVALRLYTRFRIVRAPGWDDFFIVLALVFGSTSGISLAVATRYGMGHHMRDIAPGDLEILVKIFWISNASFTTSNSLVKVSLLLQYLRTFVDPRLRRLCIGLTILTCAYGLAFAFMGWFPCFPVEGFWRRQVKAFCYGYGSRDGTELYAAVLSANAINMALDIMIFLLPIPLLFRRDTSRKTKVGLLVLFGLGIAINVIAGLRLVTNHVLNQEGDKADLTYDFVKIFVLGEAENRLSCILGSIPVFWPVVSQKIQEIFITREFRVESTYHISLDPQRRWKDDDQPQPYNGKQGGGHDIEMQSPPLGQHGKGGLEYQEDEVLETGLRHPGRLVDVDNYTRAWIGPFAEDENMQQPVISEVKAEKSSGR